MVILDAERSTNRAQAAIVREGLLMVRASDGAVRAYPNSRRAATRAELRHAVAITRQHLKPLLDACPPLLAQTVRTAQLRSVGYLQ